MVTEQPDTAALRAFYAPGAGHGPLVERDIRALCDALDAARAERDALDYKLVSQVELSTGEGKFVILSSEDALRLAADIKALAKAGEKL